MEKLKKKTKHFIRKFKIKIQNQNKRDQIQNKKLEEK
jgi:hypothetical protein